MKGVFVLLVVLAIVSLNVNIFHCVLADEISKIVFIMTSAFQFFWTVMFAILLYKSEE
jgi:hypothetical protein